MKPFMRRVGGFVLRVAVRTVVHAVVVAVIRWCTGRDVQPVTRAEVRALVRREIERDRRESALPNRTRTRIIPPEPMNGGRRW